MGFHSSFLLPFFMTGGAAPPPVEDADAAAYLNALSPAPSAGERLLVDALVKGFKSDGDWSSLGWIQLHAAETQQAGLLNLKNPAQTGNTVNSPAFVANRGFVGDGSAAHVGLGTTWTLASGSTGLNDISVGCFIVEDGATGLSVFCGASAGNIRLQIAANTSGATDFRANSTAAATPSSGVTTRTGHWSMSRSSSTTIQTYRNGVLLSAAAVVSTSANGNEACWLRSGGSFGRDRITAGYAGVALTSAAKARIDSRLRTYLTAKGAI